jgi:TolB-like protein/tetratricopeptide (TPR) repeat protein
MEPRTPPDARTGFGPTAAVIRFAGYEVNLRARELWKDGVRVRLQDQPFQILAMMLERPGDIVTREEIRARLWPDGTTVDFEHSVNAAVKRLRAALGDTAESPRFVETLHRRGYRFLAPLAADAPPPLSYRNTPRDKPRLVVLPFANLSEGPAQEYFSDGLTEEMIAQLGRLFGTRVGVIARTSSMLLKQGNQTASEIGRAFGAQYLIEGSVRREGDRVRVTAQLIETEGETHLWSESYDRRLPDVIAVQTDVAAAIARSLMIELLPGAAPAPLPGTRNAEAYQAYLKGRFHWNRPGDGGLQAALVYFDEAVALDPAFGAAYSGRARCYLSIAEYYRDSPRIALEAARASAECALQVDAGDSDAHIVIGEVRRTLDWDASGAEAAYRMAFAANPSFDAAHRCYAMFLASRGQLDQAMAIADRACELDPFCFATSTAAALVRYFAGQHESALTRCRHIIDMDPTYAPARRLMAAALEQLGRGDEALAELQTLAGSHVDTVSLACFGRMLAVSGDRKGAVAVRDRLRRLDRTRFVPAYYIALLHTGLGDTDAAFAELEAACEQRDPWLDTLGVDPRFEPLRRDPRFSGILNRLRLVQAA